jgi:hypothetical protein
MELCADLLTNPMTGARGEGLKIGAFTHGFHLTSENRSGRTCVYTVAL